MPAGRERVDTLKDAMRAEAVESGKTLSEVVVGEGEGTPQASRTSSASTGEGRPPMGPS
jgi:hypothetical protein